MGTVSGKALKFRMKEVGLNMTRLSDATGINYGSINMFFNGRQGLPEDKIDVIEKYITKAEQDVVDSKKLETNVEKIYMLTSRMGAILNEMIRICEECNGDDERFGKLKIIAPKNQNKVSEKLTPESIQEKLERGENLTEEEIENIRERSNKGEKITADEYAEIFDDDGVDRGWPELTAAYERKKTRKQFKPEEEPEDDGFPY